MQEHSNAHPPHWLAGRLLKARASPAPPGARARDLPLLQEAGSIGQEMRERLQQSADIAGVRILSFELADLSYAPEIAQMMLVRA